ncbi:MAG: hypothetical protein WCI76_00445 [bacterium]
MKKTLIFCGGIILGVVLLVAWQLVNFKSTKVHYHANFALYVNGTREMFKDDNYYEGTSNCYADDTNEPKERVHMHDNVNGLVHVHAPAVTWGHFFANIGWNLGSNYLQTRDRLLMASSYQPLKFWLNGKEVSNPAGRVIGDQDRLLVSYGAADAATLSKQFSTVEDTAIQADNTKDPASCRGGVDDSLISRLKSIF